MPVRLSRHPSNLTTHTHITHLCSASAVLFSGNTAISEGATATGGGIEVTAFENILDGSCEPSSLIVGSGLVVENNLAWAIGNYTELSTDWTARAGGASAYGPCSVSFSVGNDATFRNNVARGAFAYGGGVYLQGATSRFSAGANLTVASNRADADEGIGGGASVQDGGTLDTGPHANFSHNIAVFGAALDVINEATARLGE